MLQHREENKRISNGKKEMSQLWVPEEGMNVTPQHSTLNSCGHVPISATSSPARPYLLCQMRIQSERKSIENKGNTQTSGEQRCLAETGNLCPVAVISLQPLLHQICPQSAAHISISLWNLSAPQPRHSPLQWHTPASRTWLLLHARDFRLLRHKGLVQIHRQRGCVTSLVASGSGAAPRQEARPAQDSGLASSQQPVCGKPPGLPLLGSFHEEYRMDT